MVSLSIRSVPIPCLLAACAALAPAARCQPPAFTLYGSGCPGVGGIAPALHANGLPALGHTMEIELTQVPPGSVAALWLGLSKLMPPIDLGFAGAPGCAVLTLPDMTAINVTAPAGAAGVDVTIPPLAALAGFTFECQWLDLFAPASSLTVSNGGTAQVGTLPPPMGSLSITAPPSGPVGTVFTLRVSSVGTGDPDNLCLQIVDQLTGDRSLLRATSIVHDFFTNEDVVTATLATAARGGPVGGMGHLMMMRGSGGLPPASASACLTTPASAWAWQGFDLPGAATGMPTNFTPTPVGTQMTIPFVYDSGSNSLYCDVPPYPWGGGNYPPGAEVTTDAHGDLSCSGSAPGGHFDHFIESVAVKASCAAGISAQALVDEHAPQVQSAFDNVFGAGRLTVTSEPGARLRIQPTNPNCTLTGGGGSVVLTQ